MRKISLLFLTLLLINCSTEVNVSEVIFKIDDFEITMYEFNKNCKNNEGSIDSERAIVFLEECFIVHDALKMRYDTLNHINKRVDYTAKKMMLQKYGLLWQTKISYIVDDFMIIDRAKSEKRKKLFYFDYIIIDDIDSLFNEFNFNKETKFDEISYSEIAKEVGNFSFLHKGYSSMRWPFMSLTCNYDSIYNMQEGAVSRILEMNNQFVLFYLDKIEETSLSSFEETNLPLELQFVKEREFDKESEKMIESMSVLNINNNNLSIFHDFLANDSLMPLKLNLIELFNIVDKDSFISVSCEGFLEYIEYNVGINRFITEENLTKIIYQYYWDFYLDKEAIKLDLYNDQFFLLDKRNYRNNVIKKEYLISEIWNNIQIDSSMIYAYYTNYPNKFAMSSRIIGDIFIFDDEAIAKSNIRKVSDLMSNLNQKNISKSAISSCAEVIKNFEFEMDEIDLGYMFILDNAPINEVVKQPIPFHDKFILLYKRGQNEKGIVPFSKAFKFAEYELHNQLFIKERDGLISKLKHKYPILINRTGYEL